MKTSRAPRLVLLAAVAAFAVTGCPTKKEAETAATTTEPGPQALPDAVPESPLLLDVLKTLDARAGAILDYEVEGTIADPAGNAMGFRYAMKQPGSSLGELLDPGGTAVRRFLFDGETLTIVDVGSKTVIRQKLAGNEEQLLLTLHAVFGSFVCEGWRPPLIKRHSTTATRVDGGDVVLTMPIEGEGLKQQVITLSNNGAFKSKVIEKTDGTPASFIKVLESQRDEKTGLVFPTTWEALDGGERGTIRLTRFTVNAGLDASRFQTTVPEGYTERVEATPSPVTLEDQQ